MTQKNVKLRSCLRCPHGRVLIINGKPEPFCKKQKIFKNKDDKCNFGLLEENESHEESVFNINQKNRLNCSHSYHWMSGKLPSFYLDGTPYTHKDTRKNPCWSLEENECFIQLYNEGYSSRQIAEKMKKSGYSIAAKTRHYLNSKRSERFF